VHGELWLLPTGLIRRRLNLTESRQHGLGPTVTPPLPQADPAEFDVATVLAAHPTNKALSFDDIRQARLVKGVTTHALRLAMRAGARHKLLWLARDPAYEVLSAALPPVLGSRLLA
jgi:hypothetical protein